MSMNFNEESEKPRFMYKHNPLVARSFQIFEYKDDKSAYEPVGDYTLIDDEEDLGVTEKKVMNLIALMNGRSRLIDFSDLTKERVLYQKITDQTDPDNNIEKIIFRTYNGQGVSKESALFTVEKRVFHDQHAR